MYFRNYGLRKTLWNECLKSRAPEDPSTSHIVKATKHCWNLNDINFSRLLTTFKAIELEKSLLIICKVFKLFVNTLIAHDKYSLLNRDNLKQPIPIKLSQKQKTCSQFFSPFFKSTLNFEYFQEKGDPHSWCIFEITDSKKRGYINV